MEIHPGMLYEENGHLIYIINFRIIYLKNSEPMFKLLLKYVDFLQLHIFIQNAVKWLFKLINSSFFLRALP